MRTPLIWTLVLTICIPGLHARTWTDILGRTLEADFISATDTHVTLRRSADQQTFTIELGQLQDSDQVFARSAAQEQAKQPPKTPTVVASSPRVASPDESLFKPYAKRLKRFTIGKTSLTAKYLGTMSISSTPLGIAPCRVNGLSMGPDGDIVMASGSGTTSNMKILRWHPDGSTSDVAVLNYKKLDQAQSANARQDDEEAGYFWFFAGHVAHDQSGQIILSQGPCGPNGLFRVTGKTEKPFQRLSSCPPTRSIQIPAWNNNYAYLTNGDSIARYRLSNQKAEPVDTFFSADSDAVFLGNTLIINSQELIASITMATGEKNVDGRADYSSHTIYINKSKGGYFLIANDQMGPMAISPDGKRMIRGLTTENRQYVIEEFSLR